MENNAKLIESLIEKAAEYGRTSIELAKLKALDKAGEIVSTVIPSALVLILIGTFILFLNLGISLWLGKIFGELFYGFFAVAAFYFICTVIIHIFMHNRIKKIVNDLFVKQVLK